MGLKSFHLLFITCSWMLCAVLAFWCFRNGAEYTVLGVVSALSCFGLIGYEIWVAKKFSTLKD